MNVTIIVTWQGGRVTRHRVCGLPALPDVALVELLEQDLASYVDDGELPTSAEGSALSWVG